MQDIHVLKILDSKSNFNKYCDFIKPEALSKYARQIFKDITEWYNNNPEVDSIDWEGFSEWFKLTQHPTFETDMLIAYSHLFEKLHSFDIEADTTYDQIVKGFIERDFATQMVNHLMQVVEGRVKANGFDKIQKFLTEYDLATSRVTEQDEALVTDDIETLIGNVVGEGGYEWRLPELNISAGPLRRPNSVLVAAYTDVGKTTMALSEMSYMVPQMADGEECLYFCNEESGDTSKLRCIQALLGIPQSEVYSDPVGTARKYREYLAENGNPFHFYWLTSMTTRFVEETLKLHNPGLIVVDQLWNIDGFSNASTSTEMYTALAKWIRKIAAKAPCISIHQADGTAIGQKFVEMNQLYGSKVGMQGAFDAVITVGKELGGSVENDERGLYIPKNKMPGGLAPYDSSQKHQKWTVYIDHEHALYRSGL